MKLATWKDGSRDGQLVVVSRDLTTAHFARGRVTTLQQALDDWNFLSPQLQELSLALDEGKARHAFPFEPGRCAAPLPRAYHWAWASGGGSAAAQLLPADDLLGPCDPVRLEQGRPASVEPVLAAATGDVERGAGPETVLEGVRLLTLGCVWRVLAPASRGADGPGTPPTALATSFAPVMVTPDELGAAWGQGQLRGALEFGGGPASWPAGDAPTGPGPDLGAILALLCQTRRLRAGALVGAGCGGPLAVAPGLTASIVWRAPDGTDPFGAITLAAQAPATPPRSRFG